MDGPDAVYNVLVGDCDIGIAVEANGKWPGGEGVVIVERVTDETCGVHSSAALERGPSLDIVHSGREVGRLRCRRMIGEIPKLGVLVRVLLHARPIDVLANLVQ